MTQTKIQALVENQKRFYQTGATLDLSFRRRQLDKLYAAIQAHAGDIQDALRADLGKSDFEGFMCESGLVLTEISYLRRNLKRLSRRKTVASPLAQFPSHSYRQPMPYGCCLIMSPWNYPFLLSVDPLVDAIAAGNTAIVKPSAYSPETSRVVEAILRECFPPEYVAVVTGGRAENAALLEQPFDRIFFTGSQAVGKEVLRKAAEHLTPCVLELGGKSPCIVDETADLALAAKRIVFGKFLNCGQTCVAPDYILCHESIHEELVAHLKQQIIQQFGEDPLKNPDYGKIINAKHFSRLVGLMDPKKVVLGGNTSPAELRIAPTLMTQVTPEDAVMGEEIFGPILPVLTYRDFDRVAESLMERPHPLALYLFSRDQQRIRRVTRQIPYGGGCINDVVIHLATSAMGFGGFGESGMGAYHGEAGFQAFSHSKSIVDKKTWLDLPMRYQPYSRFYEKLLHLFLK